MRLRSTLVGAFACSLLLLSACTGDGFSDPGEEAAPSRPTLIEPIGTASVVEGTSPAALAVGASKAFFRQAPVVVVADETDADARESGATLAVELGVPMLLAPAAARPTPDDGASAASPTATATATPAVDAGAVVTDEIGRLGATTVVTYGSGATVAASALGDGVSSVEAPADATRDDLDLPSTEPAEPLKSVLALTTQAAGPAAGATAQAAGAELQQVSEPDPRADRELIAKLSTDKPRHVIALGSDFGSAEQFAYRASVASTGVELAGGGQVLYPYRRHVALYGNPTTPALGSLGEQPLPETINRARRLAAEYQALADVPVVPSFEIITTVASSVAGPDGNYSTESELRDIRPYIDAAARAGVHVVLDLQPGRSDFLTQAKLYEEFLRQPHVGLALDPEWRLGPNQVHLRQVGTVSAAEINSVVTWLADLTRANRLPQKLLILHQFKTSMISDRQAIDTSRDELAVLIHVDGFGPPGPKFSTWNTLLADPPANIWWGWKNFIDEDQPLFTPAQTFAVDPRPYFISYQ